MAVMCLAWAWRLRQQALDRIWQVWKKTRQRFSNLVKDATKPVRNTVDFLAASALEEVKAIDEYIAGFEVQWTELEDPRDGGEVADIPASTAVDQATVKADAIIVHRQSSGMKKVADIPAFTTVDRATVKANAPVVHQPISEMGKVADIPISTAVDQATVKIDTPLVHQPSSEMEDVAEAKHRRHRCR